MPLSTETHAEHQVWLFPNEDICKSLLWPLQCRMSFLVGFFFGDPIFLGDDLFLGDALAANPPDNELAEEEGPTTSSKVLISWTSASSSNLDPNRDEATS